MEGKGEEGRERKVREGGTIQVQDTILPCYEVVSNTISYIIIDYSYRISKRRRNEIERDCVVKGVLLKM